MSKISPGPHGLEQNQVSGFPRQRPASPGDNRARTGNLRRAKAALSQLSYVPRHCPAKGLSRRESPGRPPGLPRAAAVGLARIELATSRLSGVRSNHLSYRPTEATGRNTRFCLDRSDRKPRKRNAKAARLPGSTWSRMAVRRPAGNPPAHPHGHQCSLERR